MEQDRRFTINDENIEVEFTESEMFTLFNMFVRYTHGIGYKRTEIEESIYNKLCEFGIPEQI